MAVAPARLHLKLHMNAFRLFTLVVLSMLANQAFGCSCLGMGKGQEEQWARQFLELSDSVVVARVLSTSGEYASAATVQIQETIKGNAADVQTITQSSCPNFALKVAEVRVFFLSKNGVIASCSNYDYRISTMSLVALLRRLSERRARSQPDSAGAWQM